MDNIKDKAAKYPTYRLRVSAGLLAALQAQGPGNVRAQLEKLYFVAQTKPIVAQEPTGQEPKQAVPREQKPAGQATRIAEAAPQRRLSIAEMVQANEAKMQAKKNRLGLANGLKTQ